MILLLDKILDFKDKLKTLEKHLIIWGGKLGGFKTKIRVIEDFPKKVLVLKT